MATVSVAVPEELKQKMLDFEEVNWSAIARHAFEEKVHQVEFLKKIASKSKLTAKDAQEISNNMNEHMAKKFRSMK